MDVGLDGGEMEGWSGKWGTVEGSVHRTKGEKERGEERKGGGQARARERKLS